MSFNILKSLVSIAPKKDVRYYLNGIRVVRQDSQTTLYAADGHIALKVDLMESLSFDIADNTDIILCRHSLEHALKLFKKGQDVPLSIDEDGNATISGLPVEKVAGKFPDVERIIIRNQEHDQYIGLSVTTTLNAFKALDILTFSLKSKGHAVVKMEAGNATGVLLYDIEGGGFCATLAQMPARY